MGNIHSIDATPTKRSYLAIISDYDLNTAICELIDNAIDVWTSGLSQQSLEVKITISAHDGILIIEDNAGGIPRSNLHLIVQPGATTNDQNSSSIGLFGVGSKRAAISMAKEVTILTRIKGQPAHELFYDEKWIRNDSTWEVPCEEVGNKCLENHTIVTLATLRHPIKEHAVGGLIQHISETYSRFLDLGASIIVNGTICKPDYFSEWAYPPDYPPHRLTGSLSTHDNCDIAYSITAGLVTEAQWASGNWGVFMYCNKRLIVKGVQTQEVGFTRGAAGIPHHSHSAARIMVSIDGPARWMPWNSSKTGINFSHELFTHIKPYIVEVVTAFTQISKRLVKNWDGEVFSYRSGSIKEIKITDSSKPGKVGLPEIPPARPNYAAQFKELNRDNITPDDRRTELMEGVLISDSIYKTKFGSRTIFSVLILDHILMLALNLVATQSKASSSVPRADKGTSLAMVQSAASMLTKLNETEITQLVELHRYCHSVRTARVVANIDETTFTAYRNALNNLLKKHLGIRFPKGRPF